MFYPFKKRGWFFWTSLFFALSLIFALGATTTASACLGDENKKVCMHKKEGHNCPEHSKSSLKTTTAVDSSSLSQILTLDAFTEVQRYTCPMHPEIREKKSGKCPECGMKLVKEDFYEVYTCSNKECSHVSAKAGKCCEKALQRRLLSKEEYYDLAHLQDEYFCPMHPEVVSDKGGKCLKCKMKLQKRTVKMAEKEPTEGMIYICSMHPDVVSDKPGNCPRCGMKLEKKTAPQE